MIKRTFDPQGFHLWCSPLVEEDAVGFDAKELITNKDNVVLTDGEGNFSLFEKTWLGTYCGHYFFNTKKGKEAITLANDMLDWMFNNFKGTALITGATPNDNRKALWMNRRLGFKYSATIPSEVGDLQIFILTKKDFNNE